MTRLFSNYFNLQKVHTISKKWVTLLDLIEKTSCKEAKIVFVRNLFGKVGRLSGGRLEKKVTVTKVTKSNDSFTTVIDKVMSTLKY